MTEPETRSPLQRFASLGPAEREDFEERAGIYEFDAGLTRGEAELRALETLENKNGG
jgi:hypothetical protein